MQNTKVTVLGAGSWGTALANHLSHVGHEVTIWSPELDVLSQIEAEQKNDKYFPGLILKKMTVERDIERSLAQAQLIVVSVPSFAYREVSEHLKKVKDREALIVSTGKGLEEESLSRLTEVIQHELSGYQRVVALSGPSFALEVLKGLPTAVVIAAADLEIAKEAATYFHHDYFRVYPSIDIIGVEIGGAIKNIIALAVGVVDGAGMGNNARAALVTRGLAEIQRLVVAMGGDKLTIVGLSGLGDLLLTSTGDLSRNRRAGLALGQGEKLSDVLTKIGQVVEGVQTAPKAKRLAEKYGVIMPIVDEMNKLLKGETTAKESIATLLARAPNVEFR
ncbi:MAG: NAD(P)-dependent glycerol-3-phosphate dehydrogenase [Deltaproteobacteria bacterium]|nr:NAD(P)-dependent glycerol-3-phosphate dehydrogenase [Deltaproteobacteria bacterium]